MRNGKVKAAAAAALLAALAAGCGETCKTEPVAKVDDAQSCTAAPGAPVTVGVRLCPTCNQTGATCDVDTSQAASARIIQLDAIVEACEDVTSCPSTAPNCQVGALPCSFVAPSEPDVYDIVAYDAASNRLVPYGTLTVQEGASANCAFASVP